MDDLEQHRCELLHKINTIQLNFDSNESPQEPEELRDLKEQYNRVIDQIEEANPSPLGDPLEKLPTEIWQDIIRECCFDWRDGPSHSRDFDQLLTFTLVSQKWSEVIFSNPLLWSEIVIYSDMADLDAKLVTWLTLSRDLPLHINFEIPMPLSSESLQILRGQSHRIRTMRLMKQFVSQGEDVQPLVDNFLASIGDLSSLETFVNWSSRSYLDLDTILSHSRHIRMLYGIKLSQPNLSMNSMQNLHSIYTQQPFTTFLQPLSKLPNLKVVSFSGLQRYYPDMNKLPSQPIEKLDLMIDNIPISWLNLGLLQRYVGNLFPILDRVAPTLLELEVLIAWGDLGHFLSTCGQLQRLRQLKIELPANTLGTNLSSLNSIIATNVLQLDIYIGEHSWDNEEAHDNDELRNNIQWFFEALPPFGPNVTHLSISTRVPSTPPPLFAQKMPRLREIALKGYGLGSFQPFEILLPEVEKVNFSSIGSCASLISCPKAIRFNIYGKDMTNLEFKRWHNIQHLEVNDHKPDWENISLPYLQKLQFYFDPVFFSNLALHPTSFPRLAHISIGATPEWDILFIMLERRNFLTDKSISPIRVISIPLIPHITILRPLCDRLRGVFSDRPSNFTLSTQNMASLYTNPKINRCHLCQINFLSCDGLPLVARTDKIGVVSQFSNYPHTTEEILFTNLTRGREWIDAINESGIARYYGCGSGHRYPTEITGYTSIGLPVPLVSSF